MNLYKKREVWWIDIGDNGKRVRKSLGTVPYEYLYKELKEIDSLEFLFTEETFTLNKVQGKDKSRKKEFYIPKKDREKSLCGTELEIQLKNQLNQKAIAKECAEWIKKKVKFYSNKTDERMQEFCYVKSESNQSVYHGYQGFTTVSLGYEKGNQASNFITKMDEENSTRVFLNTFNQIWNSKQKVEDVTNEVISYIEEVYQENSPEKVYFLILYNIFNEFLNDLNEDVLPDDNTGYKDSVIWKKLYNFQKDGGTDPVFVQLS